MLILQLNSGNMKQPKSLPFRMVYEIHQQVKSEIHETKLGKSLMYFGWYCGKIIQVVVTCFEQDSKFATLIVDDVDYSADYINYLNLSYERNMEKLR